MASPPEVSRQVYRIVQGRYPPFDGSGAFRWGSRWISPGRQVVHAAETYALAVLENLVHWQTNSLPQGLVCVRAVIPDALKQQHAEPIEPETLACLEYAVTRAEGDRWYDDGATAVLWVPSAVSPYERNVLVNQRHPDFGRIEVLPPVRATVDSRLARTGARDR